MSRIGFCSGAYKLQSPNVANESCVNKMPETPETAGAKSAITLMPTPGLMTKYTLPEISVPGEFEVNGRAFVAASSFYELVASAGANYTVWGVLNGPSLSPTQIFSCQTHLLILSNGDLFIFVLSAFTDSNDIAHTPNEFFAVDMSQFNGPVQQIDFCDGYFFATIQNSNTFQVSNLEDGTTWSGLFISTISRFPDNIISMKVDHDIVWFLSGKKIIGYYDSGAGFPPFIPIQGAFLEDGCAATWGTVQANDTFCWIEQSERGSGVVKMMGSNVGIRISTLAIEFALQSYSTIADAVSYAYQDQGHNILQITLPTAKMTWCYDFSTSLWFRKAFFNGPTGTFLAHRSMSHMEFNGRHLVGDPQSGNIYDMSIDYYTDFGNPLVWERAGPQISAGNKYLYHDEVEFDIQMGVGPIPPLLDGDGQPRDPQVELFWIDRLTQKSNTYFLGIGQAGVSNVRARKTKLGRSRMRQYVLRGSDPVPIRICDAFLVARGEDGQYVYKPGVERLSEEYRKVT
jgi:hypothetical protein